MEHTAEEWLHIGLGNYKNGLYREAIDAFDHVTDLDSDDSGLFNKRNAGRLPIQEKAIAITDYKQTRLLKLDDAIYFLNNSINLDSTSPGAYYFRGEVKLALNDDHGALEDFNRSIQIDPNNADVYSARGFCNQQIGNEKAAILDYTKAIHIDSENSYSYYHRGLIKAEWGDFKGAIFDFFKTTEITPKHLNAYLSRSSVFKAIGDDYSSLLNINRFIYLATRSDFFQNVPTLFMVFYNQPAPYLFHRTLEKFTNDFDQFNTIHPIIDATRQQCRHWKRWEEWRRLAGSAQHESLAHYHALALVNHYMGDCIEAFRIYDEVLDDEGAMGVPLNLMGLYYYIESAKSFQQAYQVILEDAIKQIEETQTDLMDQNAFRELYYAGQILWANDQVVEAHEFFELADHYLPAAYMQVLTLPMTGASEADIAAKITDIREREAELPPSEGFLQGFPKRPFRLEKIGEDFLASVLYYAHYREIAQAIAEVRDTNQPFHHHETWDAFYWLPEEEKELDWLLRREKLAEINKALLEKFKANLQAGAGVHDLEHLEAAFAQKLKHDLWQGSTYLNFEDFKSKSEAWPKVAREVAALLRDSRRLDANDKLLLVEYCHLRGSLDIEDVYLLYFYISFVNTSEDSGITSEANSAAVKKIVELLLEATSIPGKVLNAATGGALARLFKLFLSDTGKQDHINIGEFTGPQTSPKPPDDFDVFCENFLRFISYQRETLGNENFEKQYPLEGFDDRSRKKASR